jgi:16S rRNA (guanine527-N7)-methyltransferase
MHLMLESVLRDAQARGWIGKGPLTEGIAHAQGFAACVPTSPDRFVDLGSGGGLPGLVLALSWPEARGALIESNQRRAEFLRQSIQDLALSDRITVLAERAEVAGRDPELREQADVVVARSFGPPAVVAECAAPLLKLGGHLIVSEPPANSQASRWPESGVAIVGLTLGKAYTTPFSYQTLLKSHPTPTRYPRRLGLPGKRPLF